MTNALLFAIACILGLGFVAVLSVLVEIRDVLLDTRADVRRLVDELEEDDEWAIVRGDPPFGGKP